MIKTIIFCIYFIGRRKDQQYQSVISDIFDGRILSSVQCLTCERVNIVNIVESGIKHHKLVYQLI